MGEIKVSFFGLCYVKVPQNEAIREVYVPRGGHIATLAVRVKDLDLSEGATTRNPTAIIHDDGHQIACFEIPVGRQDVTALSMSGDDEYKTWGQSDRNDSINFASHHGTFKAIDAEQLAHVLTANVVLHGGRLDSKDVNSDAQLYARKDTEHADPKQTDIARSIEWSSEGKRLKIEFNVDGVKDYVVLKDRGMFGNRAVSVTNVSTANPRTFVSANHFALYYKLVPSMTVKDDDQLTLVKGHHRHMRAAGQPETVTEEAYDCVPPGTGS